MRFGGEGRNHENFLFMGFYDPIRIMDTVTDIARNVQWVRKCGGKINRDLYLDAITAFAWSHRLRTYFYVAKENKDTQRMHLSSGYEP
jgi:hypothetical protein